MCWGRRAALMKHYLAGRAPLAAYDSSSPGDACLPAGQDPAKAFECFSRALEQAEAALQVGGQSALQRWVGCWSGWHHLIR